MQNLIGVDTYRYDESWKVNEFLAAKKLYGSSVGLFHLLLSTNHSTKEQIRYPRNGPDLPREPSCSPMHTTPESSPKPGVLHDDADPGTIYSLQLETTLLDLRDRSSFAISHLPGATSFPFASLTETTPSSFSCSTVLEMQWRELEDCCVGEEVERLKEAVQTVILVDYDGDAARVTTSVFRAQGI